MAATIFKLKMYRNFKRILVSLYKCNLLALQEVVNRSEIIVRKLENRRK